MKRLAREAAAAANPMLSPQVHRMAQQVQEVLPHISLDQIKRDLGQSLQILFLYQYFVALPLAMLTESIRAG